MSSGKLRAFVTGVSGQDGYYLTEILLSKGYEVHGFVRRGSRVPHSDVVVHVGDLQDPAALGRALAEAQPHEVYNLGAQSHVKASFDYPDYTYRVTGLPILTILEYVRQSGLNCRVYQAGSSEQFGASPPPQHELTPFLPQSPYAVAKVAAFHTARLYREAYGMFAVSGILHNPESIRRPSALVTRKITQVVAKIAAGRASELVLGNLNAYRDWGHSPDYCLAMWMMLQQERPEDFVIATGETHTVREFVEAAFREASITVGRELDWQKYVRTDAKHERPAEVPALLGDASRAEQVLGWRPRVRFEELVRLMVEHDLAELRTADL